MKPQALFCENGRGDGGGGGGGGGGVTRHIGVTHGPAERAPSAHIVATHTHTHARTHTHTHHTSPPTECGGRLSSLCTRQSQEPLQTARSTVCVCVCVCVCVSTSQSMTVCTQQCRLLSQGGDQLHANAKLQLTNCGRQQEVLQICKQQ